MQVIILCSVGEMKQRKGVKTQKKETVGEDGQWKRRHILRKGENADECIL